MRLQDGEQRDVMGGGCKLGEAGRREGDLSAPRNPDGESARADAA